MGNSLEVVAVTPATAVEDAMFRALRRYREDVAQVYRYRPHAWPPEIDFTARDVQPPANLYLPQNAYLTVTVTTTFNSRSARVNAYQILASGQPSITQLNINNQGGFTTLTYGSQLAEGYLLGVMAVPAATIPRGDNFIEAYIQLDQPTGGAIILPLFAEYLTRTGTPVGWPGSGIQPSTNGPGQMYSLQPGNPAAGTDILVGMPGNSRCEVVTFYAQLVTSATVSNRQVDLVLDNPSAAFYWRGAFTAAQTASTTINYSAGMGLSAYAGASGSQVIGLPDSNLFPGNYRVRTITTNLQAGDQWQNTAIMLQTWIDQ